MHFKTKKLLVLLLTAALILPVFSSTPAAASEDDSSYKAAYYKLIKELRKGNEVSEKGFDRFKLIYLDNDDIPELLAVDVPADSFENNNIYIYSLYTFYNGEAVKLGDFQSGVASAGGYRGNTFYIKKSGKILETSTAAASGDGDDIIYSMQDGELSEIASGKFNIADENAEWNGKSMTYDQYDKKLNKVFKTKKAKSFEEIKTVSYKSMKKKLK